MLGFIPVEGEGDDERGTLDTLLTHEQSRAFFGETEMNLSPDVRFQIFENVATKIGYSTPSLVEAIRKDGAIGWSMVQSAVSEEIARVKEEAEAREEANAAFERGRGAL